jgi:prepilin-type N-terminal cleavage/methylation domain-containing protein
MTARDVTRDGESGFTMIELLVAMAISTIVLLATLQSLDVFTTHAAQQARVTDANEQVRRIMDRTVSDLRGASVITTAAATDLVYTVAEPTGVRTERLCVASSRLYRSSTIAPATPPASCSGGKQVAHLRSTSSTAFTYDGASSSATPSTVKDVGITLSLNSGFGGKVASSTLRASAARRSAGTLPINPNDLRATCDSTGALLSLSVGGLGLGALTVTYTTSSGQILTGTDTSTVHIAAGVTTVLATVTNSLGATTTIGRPVECT